MNGEKPFIYVASLRRTGSSMLKRMLTFPFCALVFGEPKLDKGQIRVADHDRKLLAEFGITLAGLEEEVSGLRGVAEVVEYFKSRVVPKVLKVFPQVGIKEIRHSHWKYILESFPHTKVILTGRDPRDMYLSLYQKKLERGGFVKRMKRLINNKRRPFDRAIPLTPETFAEDVRCQFRYQMEICLGSDCLRVRYEDLCTDPAIYQQIRAFTETDVPPMGNKIAAKNVYRWRFEPNGKLLAEAGQAFDLLEEYCRFWGYENHPGK